MKENLKLGIELDNGEINDFLFDNFIINGLFFTAESVKVSENSENFKIKIEKPTRENQMTTNIAKRQNVVIVTFYVDNENQSQYLVAEDLNIIELNQTDIVDKHLIKEAFSLI